MTREQAQRLIDSYCIDPISDEQAAVGRLLEYPADHFNGPDGQVSPKKQDSLDEVIYG